MITETDSLNEWPKADLLKLLCIMEMMDKKGFLPLDWIDWGKNLQTMINQAIQDQDFESKQLQS